MGSPSPRSWHTMETLILLRGEGGVRGRHPAIVSLGLPLTQPLPEDMLELHRVGRGEGISFVAYDVFKACTTCVIFQSS